MKSGSVSVQNKAGDTIIWNIIPDVFPMSCAGFTEAGTQTRKLAIIYFCISAAWKTSHCSLDDLVFSLKKNQNQKREYSAATISLRFLNEHWKACI